MITFFISIVLLVLGYIFYGRFVERIFGVEADRPTPATTQTDGVDYVPMPAWRIFLIQFLNIAGLGPIFGAIMGIKYGSSAFLWIVFGTIFAGGVHDYMSGMLSMRKGGMSLPEVVGSEMGQSMAYVMRVFSIVLLVLLTTVFMVGPANLLQGLVPIGDSATAWVLIVFGYYFLATMLPIDKLIGKVYPLFGATLLFMAVGIAIAMIIRGVHIPEVFSSADIANHDPKAYPLFPMMFVSIACGAISGFHGTQSPIMARCVTNERQGRWIFYGAMVAEGVVALIWAAAAGSYWGSIDGLNAFLASDAGKGGAASVVDVISRDWLGMVGGILALIGVIACPITSGDTALRSARLIVADFLHLEQKTIWKRLVIALPMAAVVYLLTKVDFNVVWRYFSWSNQTLAMLTLWTATIWLTKRSASLNTNHSSLSTNHSSLSTHHSSLLTLLPALFMTMVCVSYIFIAPEGFDFAPEHRWIAYLIAAIVTLTFLFAYLAWQRRLHKEVA